MMAESIQDPVVSKHKFMWYSNNQEFKSRLVRNVKDIGMHVQISQQGAKTRMGATVFPSNCLVTSQLIEIKANSACWKLQIT